MAKEEEGCDIKLPQNNTKLKHTLTPPRTMHGHNEYLQRSTRRYYTKTYPSIHILKKVPQILTINDWDAYSISN